MTDIFMFMSFASVRLHKGSKAERQESNFALQIIQSDNVDPPVKKFEPIMAIPS